MPHNHPPPPPPTSMSTMSTISNDYNYDHECDYDSISESDNNSPQGTQTPTPTLHTRKAKTKERFQLALPPPKSYFPKSLRLSPLLILQIQQLSSPIRTNTRRPIPVLDIWRPSIFGPGKVSKCLSLAGCEGVRVGGRGLYVTRSEEYFSFAGEGRGNGGGDEEEIVAAICTPKKPKPQAQGQGRGRIYFRRARSWNAISLSDGVYRFTVSDEKESDIMIQFERRKTKKSNRKKRRVSHDSIASSPTPTQHSPLSFSSPGEMEDIFEVRILNPSTKKSLSIALMTRQSLEVVVDPRSFERMGIFDEMRACLPPSASLSLGREKGNSSNNWKGELYTVIVTLGIWVVLQEGWAR